MINFSILLIEDSTQENSLYKSLRNSFLSASIFSTKDLDQSCEIIKTMKLDVIILNTPFSFKEGIKITETIQKHLPNVRLYIYTEKDFQTFVKRDKIHIEIFNKIFDHPLNIIRNITEVTQKDKEK
ncbi:MAG: hypothetical protein HeimC3_16350 [Candidatus Heimdallarchaeota archaeon LC_3]|nr:MAG: hypothetical protein HeimC3_16350 [Candidatus Heimdallarchaeota archaeon LC_3]